MMLDTPPQLYFLMLFFVYSLMDIEKKEVSWGWLIFGVLSVFFFFPQQIIGFFLVFALFYLIYQFVEVGGADIIVLAMIYAILGYKLFIVYLVVLSVISLIRGVIGYVFSVTNKNVAFIPYLTLAYTICLIFV